MMKAILDKLNLENSLFYEFLLTSEVFNDNLTPTFAVYLQNSLKDYVF